MPSFVSMIPGSEIELVTLEERMFSDSLLPIEDGGVGEGLLFS